MIYSKTCCPAENVCCRESLWASYWWKGGKKKRLDPNHVLRKNSRIPRQPPAKRRVVEALWVDYSKLRNTGHPHPSVFGAPVGGRWAPVEFQEGIPSKAQSLQTAANPHFSSPFICTNRVGLVFHRAAVHCVPGNWPRKPM